MNQPCNWISNYHLLEKLSKKYPYTHMYEGETAKITSHPRSVSTRNQRYKNRYMELMESIKKDEIHDILSPLKEEKYSYA